MQNIKEMHLEELVLYEISFCTTSSYKCVCVLNVSFQPNVRTLLFNVEKDIPSVFQNEFVDTIVHV
jgi:hypothetical protein